MPCDYESIKQDNIRRRGEEFDDIGRLISEQLYTDRSHFVYELLQNAEDALDRRVRGNPQIKLPCSVKFVLFEDRLEFRHYGMPFNETDVIGVSDVLKGTKREDVGQIGKFGIGFKSVYAFTSTPEIHSGAEHFVIERYIRPKAKESDTNIAEGETVFLFPFNHNELSQKAAFELILNKLKVLGPRVLLFLNCINEIEWSVEPTGEKGQYLKDSKPRGKARQVTVIGQNNGHDEEENWLVFKRPVAVPNSKHQVHVEIGFRLETKAKDKTESIVKVREAPLVVYFPTEKITRFGFLIQGPYKTTPSRDNILSNDHWNSTLIGETSILVGDVLQNLKQIGLLSISALEAMPIRIEDFAQQGTFYPIVNTVRECLMNQELLPADDGTFVAARSAKLARGGDLRKLLNQEQLRSLFQSNDTIKWLAGEITQDRSPDLHAYLLNQLNVEEVVPDSFARKVTEPFLVSQDDDWFVDFYEYLSGQEALWRSKRWNGDTMGVLRNKPIIRDQVDSQKSPFRSDSITPNVFLPPADEADFPIVKRSIADSPKVKDFLKRLGLSEPDVFDDIVRRVLPKYVSEDVNSISSSEHAADIQKILRALRADSESGKKKVIEAVRQTAAVKAFNQDGHEKFKKPTELFFHTPELKDYFSGNPDAWFLGETEGQDEWRSLGIEDKPRFKKVAVQLPWEERKRLMGSQGHTRDIETIDYELDGVESFLSRVSEAEGSFESLSLILWNFLLMHLKDTPSYQFYEGRYKWFYYTEHSASFDATWKKLLCFHPWLPKNGDSVPHAPNGLRLADLPQSFPHNDKLADLLGMKRDIVALLAEKVGIHAADIELMKQHPVEFERWKASLLGRIEKPVFPVRIVTNPERREERVEQQVAQAVEKKFENRERSVRVSQTSIDQVTWLRNQYTNEAGQMVCQICKEVMPFKKRDGEYYFEAFEALSRDFFIKEYEAQYLALCPVCAARYNEFIKQDKAAMERLGEALRDSNEAEITVSLGDMQTSIRFVETHFIDIKTILNHEEDARE